MQPQIELKNPYVYIIMLQVRQNIDLYFKKFNQIDLLT